ncbi:MAG: hypothetical protein NTX58_07915 [Actinobacteria bacterium]|nr:hypothetical protein [Actinomycetota bacterium]
MSPSGLWVVGWGRYVVNWPRGVVQNRTCVEAGVAVSDLEGSGMRLLLVCFVPSLQREAV